MISTIAYYAAAVLSTGALGVGLAIFVAFVGYAAWDWLNQ